MIDHLVVVTSDLHSDAVWLSAQTGVEADYGGTNPVNGTHNMLFPVKGGAYLELLAADERQLVRQRPLPFGLESLTGSSVATWAASVADFDGAIARGGAAGVPLGELVHMSRRRPDGSELHWRMTYPLPTEPERLCPFLIDWTGTAHPRSQLTSSSELSVTMFTTLTRIPAVIEGWLRTLDLIEDTTVAPSDLSGFELTVSGPLGSAGIRARGGRSLGWAVVNDGGSSQADADLKESL